MLDAVFLTVAAAALTAAVHKARQVRVDHSPALAALCGFLTSVGLAFVFLSPTAETLESRLVPNLGRLLANVSTLVAAFAISAMLLHLTHPVEQASPRVRPRLLALIVAICAMTMLFLSAPVTSPGQHPTGGFGDLHTTNPALGVYVLIYSLYLGSALVDLLRLTWMYARLAPPRTALRLGLRVVTLGAAIGLVYVAEKALYVLSRWASLPGIPNGDMPCSSPFTNLGCVFSVAMPAAAVLTIAAGATLPAWGPPLLAPVRLVGAWHAYRQLHPLWTALHDAIPQIALATPTARHAVDIRFRLYRRVIEIRDGCLALRALRDATIAEQAAQNATDAGLAGNAFHAAVEAAVLTAALHYKKTGRAPQHPAAHDPENVGDHGNLAAEVDWLRHVAHAFTHTPRNRSPATEDHR